MAFALVPLLSISDLGSISAGLLPPAKVYDAQHLDAGSGWDVGFTGTFYYVDMGIEDSNDDGQSRRFLRTRMIGSREDPGTGSASSALCCYLALQEGKEKGKGPFAFHLVQGVELGRQCDIFVEVLRTDDGSNVEEVVLKGTAVEVMEGVVNVP